MEYQTLRPVKKPSYKQKTSHSYNYKNRSKTPKSSNMNTQTYSYSQSQNIPQPTSNSIFFNDQPRSTQDQTENFPFFQQKKNNTNEHYATNQTPYYTAHYSP